MLMQDQTVALICRVYKGELPYITSFIAHYKMIGVDTIYIVITKQSDSDEIKAYLSNKNYELVYLQQKTDENVDMNNMDDLLPLIKEDYLLHVDIDEYLDLEPHNSIQEVLNETVAERQHFNWAVTVNDKISDNSFATYGQTHRNRPWKTMCKTSVIKAWNGAHDVIPNREITSFYSKYKLIHYWGRNYNDILIKSIYGNAFKDANVAKTSSLEELKKYMQNDNINSLPNRLKMLAVLSRCEKHIKLDKDYCLQFIDYEKEAELLDCVTTQEERDKLYLRYVEFRNKLDYESQVKPYFKKGLLGIDWNTIVVS
jgi:hypothetical protein